MRKHAVDHPLKVQDASDASLSQQRLRKLASKFFSHQQEAC